MGAIQNTWLQTVLDIEIGETTLLKELCDYRRCVLREGKRSDIYLFNFYRSLVEDKLPLEEQIKAARVSFPDKGMATHTLVISHKRRVAINTSVQRARFQEAKEHIKLPPVEMQVACETQEMLLWRGVILVAVLPEMKQGLWNSQLLEIKELTPLRLECLDTGKTYEVTTESCQRYLRLSWSIVYASLQGRTMTHSLRLLDLGHPRMTRKMLLVALSRARSWEMVWLGE